MTADAIDRRAQAEADALRSTLEKTVDGEVRFDAGSRALYSTAASNYRAVPIGVVVPRTVDDVLATVDVCRTYGAPVFARGGGTGLAGQTSNVAVAIDFSKYVNEIIEIDPDAHRARVQPGLVLDELQARARPHGVMFGPDPATHQYCTFGGMIGNNSCGTHSVVAGRTSDNVEELEVLTYDGTVLRVGATPDDEFERAARAGGRRGDIYRSLDALRNRYADLIRARYPDIPRRVSGYNLDDLLPENGGHVARALVGSESTCVLVLEATVRLVEDPRARVLVVLGYKDVYSAGDHVPEIMAHGPIGLEGMDNRLTGYMRRKGLHPERLALLPDGGGWLIVEFGADSKGEAHDRAQSLIAELRKSDDAPTTALYDDPDDAHTIWAIRESGLGATAFVPGERPTWEGWEDAAVPPETVGDYLRDFRKLLVDFDYECSLYGHFGQGCIHTRIDFDLKTAEGVARYRSFVEHAADLVVHHGGSLSGEHGDGQSRAELLPKMFGDELVEGFRAFKAIWDPDNKMNPHKVVDPYPLDAGLRLGGDYRPPTLDTHFSFHDEGGSFADAAARCVGVGKCRKHGAGTMCPSYMVTREEKHATRGRARLLFEMLVGDPLKGRWKEDAVHEALELCLACKGCKGECPVEVDMATYKAEFNSHYYARRLRPVQAYSLGLIYWWSRLASHAPGLTNFATGSPLLGRIVKSLGGVAPQRPAPTFARETFRDWFETRSERTRADEQTVILWPDTFNNFLHPEVPKAAVAVLEAAGRRVAIPSTTLCCGRPLYDYGMLPTAKRLLLRIIEALRPEIAQGVPLVGLEPSCVAVFRDEATNLFPHDEDVKRLAAQTFTLAEYLDKIGYEPPALPMRALVHVHCHHNAVIGYGADRALLKKMGVDFEVLDSGCCGLAGSFGFEKGEKYDVSVACGERVLAPAVRAADEDTLILTDGFSCHTQIDHLAGRKALHLAQVLELAINGKDG